VGKSTNQVQAFHEPPSLRPHCSSSQQWVTPELGLSSTPRQGFLGQAEVIGKNNTEISGRILPKDAILRPLLPESHSLHACSAREYTPSHAQSIGANLPLWVSEIGQIRNSQSRSWCWALSGRNHFPANSFS
jgi:hypothetical protein